MALDTMLELLVEQLRDLYSAEHQVRAALPRMLQASTNDELAECIRRRMAQTTSRCDRLEAVLEYLGASPEGKRCKAMQGLVVEGVELLLQADEDFIVDAGLVAQIERMEHYEIAGYASAKAMARHLGRDRVARVLDETLKEQIANVRALADLAEREVNPRAVLAGGNSEQRLAM